MLRRLLIGWASNFLGVIVAAAVFEPHIKLPPFGGVDYWTTAAAFAGLLAVLNSYIRPILYLLFAPITCLVMILTLGLAHFLAGALMFWLAGQFVTSIQVESFGYALLGAAVTAAAGLVAVLLLEEKRGAKV